MFNAGTKFRIIWKDFDGIMEIIKTLPDNIYKVRTDYMEFATGEWGKEEGYFKGDSRFNFLIDSGMAMVV